ncbi:MAG: DUF7713 domain-containing protein [Acetobacteraceae bacterium]
MARKPSRSPTPKGHPKPAPLHCDTCHQPIGIADGVSYGSMESGYRELCSRCFNQEVASRGGLDFQHVAFEPLQMQDASGASHTFHFGLHLLGDRVSLDALELRDDTSEGYQFQIIDDAEADLFGLMGQLVERMRRALAQRHLEEDGGQLQIADFVARGRITCDLEQDGRVPVMVIDGREITWEEFGRMLMTFEGWQFKLEIHDRSEEV